VHHGACEVFKLAGHSPATDKEGSIGEAVKVPGDETRTSNRPRIEVATAVSLGIDFDDLSILGASD
jgi:hypothetical protein